jgi:hypothetical protein
MCFGTSLKDVLDQSATQAPSMPNNPINITLNSSISSFRSTSTNPSSAHVGNTSISSLRSDSGKSFNSYTSSIASENSSIGHYVRRRNSGSVRSSLYNHSRRKYCKRKEK